MARGNLRIYLGAAPGVGKTFAMLNEGKRAQERGTDVVVGLYETHGRKHTEDQLEGLEVIPRKTVSYKGREFTEMDLDAILARAPERVLVDELAHTNVPGCSHEKRWQDVEALMDAGIDIISTLNIQHLESVNDVVEKITGVKQAETIPDAIVRQAEQVELVDMTPEAIRRRMAHGNIYPAERIDASLANYFRVGNLYALRELALLWVADRVEENLQQYLEDHGIEGTWETRERVVVAITGAPGGDVLIRRAARMARRAQGDLVGVHVRPTDGLAGRSSELLEKHRQLLTDLGGTYQEVAATDVGSALVNVAMAERGTQLVLGESRQSRWTHLIRGSVISRVLHAAESIDVHVISTVESGEARSAPPLRRRAGPAISRRRQGLALLVAAVTFPLLTLVLDALREQLSLPSVLLIYLLVIVGVAAIGGFVPAVLAAIAAFLLGNYFFTHPIHTFTIADSDNLVALIVFVIVAAVVGELVSRVARRRVQAARNQAEAETLARLSGTLLSERDPVPALMVGLRDAFDCGSVSILRRDGDAWRVESSAGDPVPKRPEDAQVSVPLDGDTVLAVCGQDIGEADLDTLRAFTGQLALAVERRRLRAEAAAAEGLQDANSLRTALLAAVSHDLRTPLASIKASVTSLLQADVTLNESSTGELLETIDEETDRLNNLVGNLLDMSRLQAGALELVWRDVGLDEVVPAALKSLGDIVGRVVVDVPETLARVHVDAALLERSIANVIANALHASPPNRPVRVFAGGAQGRVQLSIADEGPGIPRAQREEVFRPFQRLGDSAHDTGVGLGLAVARGFVEVMEGTLTIEDTPGGGTTVLIDLPIANRVAREVAAS
jgi:two-component system, OmpR family, sensor histidine kinase KdpD